MTSNSFDRPDGSGANIDSDGDRRPDIDRPDDVPPDLHDLDPTRTTNGTAQPAPRPDADHDAASSAPRHSDRYRILAEHGRGGLGRVYRARDRELGRDVALKELLQPSSKSEIRFFREAFITARLEHPAIVPVHDVGRWRDGTPYYAMKLVAGRPLTQLIDTAKSRDERLALLPYLIAVADAIAYAHARKVIHRDLKPSNVIVGDFGETIVIDWGLAKELTAAPDELSDDPYRVATASNLTIAGGIVGTPAYMSPEQARGEPVDTRTDVYSLGAILFQLCTGGRPPANVNGADLFVALRRSPEDLATIAVKSLSFNPDDRYPDAAAFAADLKAYDAGVRITARKYSFVAMLRLWIRHNQRLATSIALSTAVLTVLGGFAVREIVLRGDRASAARWQAEAARDELILKNAELVMQSDPSAAAAVLRKYTGHATAHRDFLLAKAYGQGVARVVAQPHRDTVFFLRAIGDDILSVSADGRVVRTTKDASRVLARDFGSVPAIAYAPDSRALVYAREPDGLAVIDVESGRSEQRHADLAVTALAVSPDGSQFAVAAQSGFLAVESFHYPTARRELPSLRNVKRATFADAATLVVLTKESVVSIDLSGPHPRRSYPISGNELATELAIRDAHLVIGDTDGSVHYIDLRTMTGRLLAHACEGTVNTVKFVPRRALVAFACQEGAAGIIDVETRSVTTRFSTERAAYVLATSLDGRLVLVGGQSGILYAYDLETSFISRYRGHAASISALIAPETESTMVSGDVNGAIRVWEAPRGAFRQLFRATRAVFHAVFAPDGQYLVADGVDGVVRMFDLAQSRLMDLKGHTDIVQMLSIAPNSKEFASVSFDGTARLWSRQNPGQSRVLTGHQGAVQDLCFLNKMPVTSGTDGRLLAWSPDGSFRELFRTRESIVSHECLSELNAVVLATTQGKLYTVADGGVAQLVANEDAPITAFMAATDGRTFATGTSDGAVRIHQDGVRTRLVVQAGGTIAHLDFSRPQRGGRPLLAVASEDGRVFLRELDGSTPAKWFDVAIPARSVRFSPDGQLLAITCNDGAVWYYSFKGHLWTFTQPHQTDVYSGRFSPDGKYFVSSDGAGVVILHDLSRILVNHAF